MSSLIDKLFYCCRGSESRKTEQVLDSHNEESRRSNKRLEFSRNEKIQIITKIKGKSNEESTISSCFQSNKSPSCITSDSYSIKKNEIFSFPTKPKKLEITDKIGSLLFNKPLQLSYKEKNKSQQSYMEDTQKNVINSIAFFWIIDNHNDAEFNGGEDQKHFILNFSSNYLSNLSDNFFFLLCYNKEQNLYKLKFNDYLQNNFIYNNIFIQIPHFEPKILYNSTILTIGSVKLCINYLSKYKLEIINLEQTKKIVFNPSTISKITLGKGRNCNLSFENHIELSDVHCTIFFNLFSKKWMIRDGEGNAPSSSGTWIFTTNPVIISNEMVVKLWGNELLFRYK